MIYEWHQRKQISNFLLSWFLKKVVVIKIQTSLFDCWVLFQVYFIHQFLLFVLVFLKLLIPYKLRVQKTAKKSRKYNKNRTWNHTKRRSDGRHWEWGIFVFYYLLLDCNKWNLNNKHIFIIQQKFRLFIHYQTFYKVFHLYFIATDVTALCVSHWMSHKFKVRWTYSEWYLIWFAHSNDVTFNYNQIVKWHY